MRCQEELDPYGQKIDAVDAVEKQGELVFDDDRVSEDERVLSAEGWCDGGATP